MPASRGQAIFYVEVGPPPQECLLRFHVPSLNEAQFQYPVLFCSPAQLGIGYETEASSVQVQFHRWKIEDGVAPGRHQQALEWDAANLIWSYPDRRSRSGHYVKAYE